MKSTLFASRLLAFVLLAAASLAQAANVTGTVTNKTTGKPSAGDNVVLVDVQAGMSDAASATTDANGHYSLNTPGPGPYLIRANHQGGTYFIAAPQNGGPGDITVYDVAPKVDGIGIDADMMLAEATQGTLNVQERYLVRNTSTPPRAQLSKNTFEIVLPPDAVLDSASATRPGGMATNTRPTPLGQKGHYTFNIPIQPNQGEKETLFEVEYHVPYKGSYTFKPQPQMPTDNLVVYLPKSMNWSAASGATFQPVQDDARVNTYVAKNLRPGQTVAYTIAGEGQMPREAQGGATDNTGTDTAAADNAGRPGGGIGAPIGSPDPLTKYKWWILAGLALLLAAAAAFLLRKQQPALAGHPTAEAPFETRPQAVYVPPAGTGTAAPIGHSVPAAPANNATLLNILKEELFALESERIAGSISATEYAEVKLGLEALMKRAMRRQ